jgi:hypothetical protein
VQRVERRQPEAIGTLEEVKELPFELRRTFWVFVVPVGRVDQIIDR